MRATAHGDIGRRSRTAFQDAVTLRGASSRIINSWKGFENISMISTVLSSFALASTGALLLQSLQLVAK